MKFLLVLTALVGLTVAAPAQKALEDDISELLAIIPWEQIDAIVADFLANDVEYQDAVAWLQGEEFAGLGAAIGGDADVQALVTLLTDAGVDIVGAINGIINILLGNGAKTPAQGPRTIQEFIDAVTAVIPVNDLAALVLTKLQSSPEFYNLFVTLQSQDTKAAFEAGWANADLQTVVAKITSWGLDVQGIVDFIYTFLGW